MKRDNNLIKVTNLKTNEVWWCTKTTYASRIMNCTPASVFLDKYKDDFNVVLVDGSEVKWKDINAYDIVLRNNK